MSETRTLLYEFRGKVESEVVDQWDARRRMVALQNCCATTIYQCRPEAQTFHVLTQGLRTIKDPQEIPEVIRLAAMLVN